ncbi:MAG: type I-E CRISPR-associated protein Cas7/Cse4/CasC [Chitinispirillaceae bacterium]|nr:type I-E CRISPR-associated protein Cas7/Cse4/CasC [Chitinispirillaceae bacterium]
MRHIELHILQSFPVSCLNRDDLNSPKTAVFGGVQRARVSSQCWKRAVRVLLKEEKPEMFKGERTRYIIKPLVEALKKIDKENEAGELALKIASELATKDNELRTKTLFFSTQQELGKFAEEYAKAETATAAKNIIKKMLGKTPADAADIALFGRMVASDYTVNLEGAAMFSHALSTHKVENEMDYFSAVDDCQPEDAIGAGMTSTLEYNSATYYRFAALNLDMLFDENHLKCLELAERKKVVRAFIKATLQAVPVARKNSMNGNVPPNYVLCVLREKGHPIQLVNAFEEPIQSKNGIIKKSIEAVDKEYQSLKKTWGLGGVEVKMPNENLDDLLGEVEKHVN